MIYKGWIIADREEKEFLEKLGVKLGEYDERSGSFENCELSPETPEKLDPYWGHFFWGLYPDNIGKISDEMKKQELKALKPFLKLDKGARWRKDLPPEKKNFLTSSRIGSGAELISPDIWDSMSPAIKKNTLEDWVKEKYIHDAKFKTLVKTLLHLMVSGDFTPVELKQALDFALSMQKEVG